MIGFASSTTTGRQGDRSMYGGKSLLKKGHPIRQGARHCRHTSAESSLIILHSTTRDIPDGRPPPDSNALWAVVRRDHGCTLWRAIQLGRSPVRPDFCNFPNVATARRSLYMVTRDEVFPSKYLKAVDLKGKPRIVKIESAPYET